MTTMVVEGECIFSVHWGRRPWWRMGHGGQKLTLTPIFTNCCGTATRLGRINKLDVKYDED